MTEALPIYVPILFILTVILTIAGFYLSANRSKTFLAIALSWAILQTLIALSGFYLLEEAIPPRIILFGVFPCLIFMVVIFLTSKGRSFIDQIDLKKLTYFHTIRIPVEIVLILLYHHGLVSVYMTYEGTNFDLISGLTAPLAGYFFFKGGIVKRKLLLYWNILCLLLLLNVVITAVFAFPSPLQILSPDQPNVAVMYFPFSLLPGLVVPLVLFAHLVAIRRLLQPPS